MQCWVILVLTAMSYLRWFTSCLRCLKESLYHVFGWGLSSLYVGQILRAQGRIQESLALFQAATCLNPQNPSNLKQVGRCLFLLGKHKAALDVYDEAQKVRVRQLTCQVLCFNHVVYTKYLNGATYTLGDPAVARRFKLGYTKQQFPGLSLNVLHSISISRSDRDCT